MTLTADQALALPLFAITDRTPSEWRGHPRDYYSVGFYSWPNPDTPDGLPYVRRDCQRNVATLSDRYDKHRFWQTIAAVNTLVQAHIRTGEDRFADSAVRRLERWFLDPEVAMRPNFVHGAAQPGVHDGASIGLIEAVYLIDLLDHVELLLKSGWFTGQVDNLRSWFADLMSWMRTSDLGRKEESSTSNHGVWWDAQVLRYASFTDDQRTIEDITGLFDRRLRQIAPGGTLPRELARPSSLHYTIYGLRAFAVCSRVAAGYGADLWNSAAAPGRGRLVDAYRFWADHARDERNWTWPRIPNDLDRTAYWLAIEAASAYNDEALSSFALELRERELPLPEVPLAAALNE
ncbi:alginate lyase family protein [Jiangella endophytica]|uniref:alginate lyase family protein n=1 Tax=Jiangella endophytica TaxID=1623398 RepID=UPI000E3472C3|nr:alginate lyase family protein [Jiangella endophytica]